MTRKASRRAIRRNNREGRGKRSVKKRSVDPQSIGAPLPPSKPYKFRKNTVDDKTRYHIGRRDVDEGDAEMFEDDDRHREFVYIDGQMCEVRSDGTLKLPADLEWCSWYKAADVPSCVEKDDYDDNEPLPKWKHVGHMFDCNGDLRSSVFEDERGSRVEIQGNMGEVLSLENLVWCAEP